MPSSLELGMYLEELATFSPFGDKTFPFWEREGEGN